MLSREDFFMIKQLRQQGTYLEDIAQRIGCSERTVRRRLKDDKPLTGKPKKKRPAKLDPYKPFIDEQLDNDIWNAEVLYQMIREQGYTGCRSSVRQYVRPKRPLRSSRKTVRFETEPGHQLQHDWGELFSDIGAQRVKVYIAVNTLGYSRRFHVWAAPSLDAEHTYESIVRSLRYFGGVPRDVLVDNQKAAVLRHISGAPVVFNEGFLALAHHYGFRAKACRPMRPRTKGKTERMVGYVKHHFFQRYRRFESFAHLNQLLEQWLQTTADQRLLRQFDQTPAQRFVDEAGALKPLPTIDFDTRYRDVRCVSWDGYIEVRGNRYSVPETHCNQIVTVRISLDDELTVYSHDDQVLCRHRLQDRSQGWQTQPVHHAPLWQQATAVEKRQLSVYEEVLS